MGLLLLGQGAIQPPATNALAVAMVIPLPLTVGPEKAADKAVAPAPAIKDVVLLQIVAVLEIRVEMAAAPAVITVAAKVEVTAAEKPRTVADKHRLQMKSVSRRSIEIRLVQTASLGV